MDYLLAKSNKKVTGSIEKIKRLIYDDIQWKERLILLLGYRGVGKTTLMLQRLREFGNKGIYFSMDDLFFESYRLVTVVEHLYTLGFRAFFIDEVHRYAFWSKDLKQLYDDYEDIHIVATGTSMLEVSKGQADLSRRSVVYQLEGLSFQEYLQFEKKLKLSPIDLETILDRHYEISADLSEQFSLKRF
jgi:hypothetical protein